MGNSCLKWQKTQRKRNAWKKEEDLRQGIPGPDGTRLNRFSGNRFVDSSSLSNKAKVGARLSKFWLNWEKITGDQWVLETVRLGFAITFEGIPEQGIGKNNVTLTKEMSMICEKEVESFR